MNDHEPILPVAELRQFDVICDRFEKQWQDGDRPDVEHFLQDVSDAGRRELARQLLEVELEYRRRAEESCQLSEYQARFPWLEPWLSQRWEQFSLADDALANDALANDAVADVDSTSGQADDPSGAPTAHASLVGRTFGKYMITEELGAGGMGAVYRARHTMIQYERALKLLRPDLAARPQATRRFLQEAQACVELSHPNIVVTYHVDQDEEGAIYLVLELLEGQNLNELVVDQGPLPLETAARIIQQVAAGLHYAHQRGTIHRDIKPHNVMLTSEGVAKLLDFGLVRILDSEVEESSNLEPDSESQFDAMLTRFQTRFTNERDLLGTLPYMSPEQAADARHADEQSDVYSLGCTFYFLLTGHHALAGGHPEAILRKHLEADYVPARERRPEIPGELVDVLDRMMSVDRSDRYGSALEVHDDLSAWLSSDESAEEDGPPDSRPGSLEDVIKLRETLVDLGVVSVDEWDAAERDAQRLYLQQGSAGETLEDDRRGSDSVSILKQLQVRRSHSRNPSAGISEFQMRHILNGEVDLLRLPAHVLTQQLGHGWKGDVFKATRLETSRPEVVRTIPPRLLVGLPGVGRQRFSAFEDAVERLKRLKHAGIPEVYSADRFDHRLHGELAVVSCQFVVGNTLADHVHRRLNEGRSKEDVAWCVSRMVEACLILAYVHSRGVLHLDIHAGCLKLDGQDQVKLRDVGIAPMVTRQPEERRPKAKMTAARSRSWSGGIRGTLAAESSMTVEPPPVGTPLVMPPEQWQNREHVSVSTDIYNLGCTFYFMIAGRYPFEGKGALDLMQKHLSESPWKSRAAERIPTAWRGFLEPALAKKPQERYASASEMAEALERVAADNPSAPPADKKKGLFSKMTGWIHGKQ